ncbi:hypothetical protein [Streptomyces sp. NPDC003710]
MIAGISVVATGGAVALAASGGRGTAGLKGDRTAITSVGYKVTPAGRQTRLGNLPLNAVIADPAGKTLYESASRPTGTLPSAAIPTHSRSTSTAPQSPDQYSGSMMKGTLSTIGLEGGQRQLERWTRTVIADNGFEQGNSPRATGAVVPRRVGEKSPIEHVIHVVKENRTYDQELGSLGKGDGDASLDLFGDDSAPNARSLQRQFVRFDYFHADAEVSAQGWNWTVAANSNPYSEEGRPANYSGRNHSYPSENDDPAIAPNKDPEHAYIWQRLADHGVSFRNYGFYASADKSGKAVAEDPVLNAGTDHDFGPYNLRCPDSANTFRARAATCGSPRIEEWKKEFARYEKDGELPSFEMVRLPNDHTSGTKAGMPARRRTSPTTTGRSGSSSTRCRTRGSGSRPRSS